MAAMRFVAPPLANLPPPPAVEGLDFEVLLQARLDELGERLTDAGLDDIASVLVLEAEPLAIAQQAGAAIELAYRQRINEAVRACLIATAAGEQLDHLALTFYGVARLVLVEEDLGANPPVAEVLEGDGDYRARALLSLEAHSSAGPEGGYLYFTLSADPDVLDAAIYGEEDDAIYGEDGDAVIAPEVLVVALSRVGNGAASEELLGTIAAALNAEEVRPIGDRVTVEPATVIEYSVEGVLYYAPGADPAPLLALAQAQVEAHCAARHRVGRKVQRLGVGAAMKVSDVDEIEVTLLDALGEEILAEEIDPGSKGAAYCTGVVLSVQVGTDSWR